MHVELVARTLTHPALSTLQYRVHVFIQCFTFVVVPLFVQVSGPLLRLAFRGDDALLRG